MIRKITREGREQGTGNREKGTGNGKLLTENVLLALSLNGIAPLTRSAFEGVP